MDIVKTMYKGKQHKGGQEFLQNLTPTDIDMEYGLICLRSKYAETYHSVDIYPSKLKCKFQVKTKPGACYATKSQIKYYDNEVQLKADVIEYFTNQF